MSGRGYDFFLAGAWRAPELLPLLADGFRVRPDEIDLAHDEEGAHAEDRNWGARVLGGAAPLRGDCSWVLEVYAHGLAEPPDSRTLARRLARRAGRVVLYSAPLNRPSAYWMAAPDGRVGRARMYDPDDDWPVGTWRLDAVEVATPQLPLVPVEFIYEMIGDEAACHPLAHALRDIVATLRAYCPEGRPELRGSLATAAHDRYSDIDLRWTVPGERFAEIVAGVGEHLAGSHPLLAARSDPDFHDAPDRRLLTYFFRELPLFRRLDLELRAATPPVRPVPTGGGWPLPVSALANALGAVKAVLRGRPEEEIRGLLDRGFARIGAPERALGDRPADIVRLVAAAERAAGDGDPAARALGARLRELVRTELVEGGTAR